VRSRLPRRIADGPVKCAAMARTNSASGEIILA